MSLNRHNTWAVISETCQDPFIQSSQHLYLFFSFSICCRCCLGSDCRMLWNSSVSPAHIWHPWSSEVSKRHRFFKAPKYIFPCLSILLLFFFLMCRWKRLCWPFQALLGWKLAGDHIDSSAAERNTACQTGNRWRGDRGESGWWGRWEGTRDDQHLWELFDFLLQHHWTCLALEAQTTISGNPAEVLLNVFTKMVWSISTKSTNCSPTQHDTRYLPSGWSQTILDVEVLGWCGFTWSAVVKLPNSLKCLRRQIIVEKWPFSWGATALVDVLAVSMPIAHSRPATSCCALSRGQPEVHLCNNPAVYLACWYVTPVEGGEVLTKTDWYGFVNEIWEK